ncbi:FtsK/SpoIIIE domain-containing protein [Parafrankia sp. FMc6]|uniref:FtsK/SpoIIIE domain-containing protein n=1 Tax=Parafrankia soli TaxID=2599596 RepID=UPI0034D46023
MTAPDQTTPAPTLPADLPTPGQHLPAPADKAGTEVHPPAWAQKLTDAVRGIRWRAKGRFWWAVVSWRVTVTATRGTRRTGRAWWVWLTVAELTKAMKEPSSDTLKVFERRSRTRWFRLGISAAGAGVGSGVVLLALQLPGWAGLPVLLVPAWAGAVIAGRDRSKPLMGSRRGTVAISGNTIIDAHRAAGIIKAGENLDFRVPPIRDTTSDLLPAMRMVYDLPGGKTYDELLKKLRPLGSALRRPIEAIDVQKGEHEGQVDAWIAEVSPYKVPVPPWPWLDRAEVDLFTEPVPQGPDLRGRPVRLPLLWTAVLVSARPRRGKSFEVRKLALAGALDPYVRLILVNPKQSGDFRPLKQIAYRYVERDAKRTVEILREQVAAMWRAYNILADLPVEMAPESKITREIHRNPALDARLTMVVFDEIQIPFEDEEHGEEIAAHLTTLAKVGPAAGFIVIAATQRPDNTVVPIPWRAAIGTRIALQLMTEGDAKVGMGSHHSDQFDASRLPSTPGVAIVAGDVEAHAAAPDGPRITRLHLVSTLDAQAIATRARARRAELGLLEGDAAGDTGIDIGNLGPEISQEQPSLLHLVRGAFGDGDRLTSADLCERLKVVGLEMDPVALAERLDPYGVGPTDIRTPVGTRRGYRLDDVTAAIGP